jgi:ATP-dependent DNA helicase RecQ
MLEGATAFRAVEVALSGAESDETAVEPAFSRLLQAIRSARRGASDRPSGLDLAVLIRQALRYWSLRTGATQTLWIPDGAAGRDDLQTVGMSVARVGDGIRVSARAWSPPWLGDVPPEGADAVAAGEVERRHFDTVRGDPFLRGLGFSTYRSAGQRTAVRAALAAEGGSTLAICLATGEGKSLVFQAIASLGYGEVGVGGDVTLVITPTVALALDHERATSTLGFPDRPRAYRGGDQTLKNDQIAKAIADGSQGLVFASPEAACGPLAPVLSEAAARGYLRAFVVDEAHLVDSWGDEFRPAFQMLAGLRRSLLEQAGGRPFRTLLLTATLSETVVRVLRVLFAQRSDGTLDELPVVAAPRLRPEVDYWIADATAEAERATRVLEAVMHLPRAAILYVSTRAQAEHWFRRLTVAGLRRIALVTGESPTNERERIVLAWQRESIDLVVATSAFGLGIDYPHVRSVLHACMPETLDRFYQEVGRGGRDGRASISLLVPSEWDRTVARALNQRRLITVDVGLPRWEAMFHDPDRIVVAPDRFRLRLDVPPGAAADRIDMVSERSTGWNMKTLTLLAGATMLVLEGATRHETGPERSDADDPANPTWHPYAGVRILEPGHLDRSVWATKVDPHRRMLAQAARESLRLLERYINGDDCVGSLLAMQYRVSAEILGGSTDIDVAPSCHGCRVTRRDGTVATPTRIRTPPYPWRPRPPEGNPIGRLVDETGRLVIYYDPPLVGASQRARRRLFETLAMTLRSTTHNIVAPEDFDLEELQQALGDWALFAADAAQMSSLPPGPTLVVSLGTQRLGARALAPRPADQARIFLIPRNQPDTDFPGMTVLDRYGGRQVSLEDLQDLLRR